MKINKFKGLAYDLADHLNREIGFGQFQQLVPEFVSNVLEQKNQFDKYCYKFVKERVSEEFDFSRVKKIEVKVSKTMTTVNTKVTIIVDDKEFKNEYKSMEA